MNDQPAKAAQFPRIYTDASVLPVGGIKRIGGHWSIYRADSWPDEYVSTHEVAEMLQAERAKIWEEAAKMILKFPRATQDTMIANFEAKAAAEKEKC